MKKYYSLCTPAQIYFLLSIISVLGLVFQNYSNPHSYSVGTYRVNLKHHNFYFFLLKIVYVLIWTFLLDQLCKKGWSNISWFLVLFPFMLMFVIIGLLILVNIR